MIYWAGLRGAVGVALAEGFEGKNRTALRATVLLAVILSVIIFGGTTARMLEILQIRTGVVEELDSDDEFDTVPTYNRKTGPPYGVNGKLNNGNIGLRAVNGKQARRGSGGASSYSTGSTNGSPPVQPDFSRRSSRNRMETLSTAEQGLLSHDDTVMQSDDENDLDLPPSARKSPAYLSEPESNAEEQEPSAGGSAAMTARGAINAVLNATTEDAGTLFSKLDENFLKPHLLLGKAGRR